jgi:hypothetical protein
MKAGQRKFLGFLITIVLYTVALIIVVTKMNNLIVDLSVFAVQAAMGYGIVAGLFFGTNVLEHFANRNGSANKNKNRDDSANE